MRNLNRVAGIVACAFAFACAGAPGTGAAPVNASPRLDPTSGEFTSTAAQGAVVFDRLQAECVDAATPDPTHCAVLRGYASAQTIFSIWNIVGADDPRDIPRLTALLGLNDDPEIQLEALIGIERLGGGADVAPEAWRLLFTPSLRVQEEAARVVGGNDPNVEHQRVAEQWLSNHQGLIEPDLAPAAVAQERDLVRLGFQAYPDAVPYPPAESGMSAGWSTADKLEDVVAFYAKAGPLPMDTATWRAANDASMQHGDPAAFAAMSSILSMTLVPTGDDQPMALTAQYFPLEGDGMAAKRLLVVYHDDAVDRTIIELAWDSAVYGLGM